MRFELLRLLQLDPERLAELRRRSRRCSKPSSANSACAAAGCARRDDPATYMEVYEGIADEAAFEALLGREGAKLGLPRKVERFVSA